MATGCPLATRSQEDLLDQEVEILVLLSGVDETFAQMVHARSSYRADEIVFGARFRSIFLPQTDDGAVRVDLDRLHAIDPE